MRSGSLRFRIRHPVRRVTRFRTIISLPTCSCNATQPRSQMEPEVHPMDDLIPRLAALDTCAISDALDKLGLSGAVMGIAALTGPAKVAGRVVTTKLGAPLPGLPKRHLGAGAVMVAKP